LRIIKITECFSLSHRGPENIIFSDSASLNPEVTIEQPGTYVFRLTGTDDLGQQDEDDVTVTVTAARESQKIDISNEVYVIS
jgi:hypothetical protein